MAELSVRGQYTRVIFLGVSFMIMFTSFNSLQNIVSKLYEEYHYNNMGQTAILFLYAAFGISTFFTSFIVKTLGYKKTLFFSSLGYAIFEATGLIIVTGLKVPKELVWVIIITGAIICGVSASALWVAQGAYTSAVASENRKSELFGLFWGLMMSSQILGNLLTTFILGKMSNTVYFVLLTILGFTSSLLFLFLPSVTETEPLKEEAEQHTIKEEVRKVWAIASDSKYKYLNAYFFFPGLCVSFYAGFLYKLVKLSVIQHKDESDADYNHRLNFSEGLVFITLGLSQLITGIIMNRIGDKFCKFKLAIVGTLIVEVAAFTSFICFFTNSYVLCFFCAYLWGTSENFLQTNTNALVSTIFPGRVEGYSVYRVFFSVGVVVVLLINILLSSTPSYYFLTIILAIQAITTGISLNLGDLKNDKQKESLISQREDEEN